MRWALFFFGLAVSLAGPAAYATQQCACATIDAIGDGNSSCSTAEYNRRCTISFNQFDFESQRRSLAALDAASRQSKTPFSKALSPVVSDRREDAGEELQKMPDDRIAGTIILYMIIPATVQREGRAVLGYDEQDFNSLVSFAVEQEKLFVSVFRGKVEERVQGGASGSITYTYSSGCMDVKLPKGLIVMFKANWSRSAAQPRCGTKQ